MNENGQKIRLFQLVCDYFLYLMKTQTDSFQNSSNSITKFTDCCPEDILAIRTRAFKAVGANNPLKERQGKQIPYEEQY